MNDQKKSSLSSDLEDDETTDIGFAECTDIRFSRSRRVQIPTRDEDSLGFIVTRNAAPPPASPAPPRPKVPER